VRSLASLASLVMLAAALMTGCNQAPPASAPVDQAAIGAAVDSVTTSFFNAFAARDTDAVAAFYTDDAHLLPANMARADGRDAIRAGWAGFMSTPGVQLTGASNGKVVSEAGDLVVDLGTYSMKWQDAKGKEMVDTGKYVTVYKKTNGAWKIVVDTFNSDMPIPGM
jgi:uncharacterized protein (TIGR02246 family)